jgi:hypothetical protein
VSTNFFTLLGTTAAYGRVFDASADSGGASLAVATHAFWLSQLGGDRNAVGKSIGSTTSPTR